MNDSKDLNSQEQRWLDLLAQYLIPKGWSADYSCKKYWQLIQENGKENGKEDTTESTIKRFLDKLEKQGFIEIKRRTPPAPNHISLKHYKYHGVCLTGAVPLNSPLYIKRGADELCKQYMSKYSYGSIIPFIRIKAARETGKTSLLIRLKKFLQDEQQCKVILVDINTFDHRVLNDENETQFFNTFTESILSGLKEKQHSNFGNTAFSELPAAQRCTYVLEPIFHKLKDVVLLIDGVDRTLRSPTLKTTFTGFLRTWYEYKMKMIDETAPLSWARIAIAYSTDPYTENNIRDSPLDNVGTLVDLEEFTADQIDNLSRIYGLDWNSDYIFELMELVGGHPYLINLALYEFSVKKLNKLDDLVNRAISENSPFINHLRKCMNVIEQSEDLSNSIRKLLNGQQIDRKSEFHLTMLGIVKQNNKSGDIEIRCSLYKRYFKSAFRA